jgi:hypothetical protein
MSGLNYRKQDGVVRDVEAVWDVSAVKFYTDTEN